MELSTPWDIPTASTQDVDFTGVQIKPDRSVCDRQEKASGLETDQTQLSHQASISGQPSTGQGSANMEEFDFFKSFQDDTQSTPNPMADGSNLQQDQSQQMHHLTQFRTGRISSCVSDPIETCTSLSTSSSTSSSSPRHIHPLLTTRHSAPTPMHTTAIDSNTNAGSPWNQMDPHFNVPRPTLSLLHLAVAAGNADTLRLLLQDLALPVNKRDQAGYTPLQRAVMSGRTDLVTVLLEGGAGAATDDESDWSLDADLVPA
ncbi:hypothetical protein GQ44DRAFT_708830 [Phaeosphaeriaceae sp. PMI808]|nr:hypothetical protein GQ44DRAFT_708830 [Phaeosphaeriaceae sp. PMI808]